MLNKQIAHIAANLACWAVSKVTDPHRPLVHVNTARYHGYSACRLPWPDLLQYAFG